MGKHRLSSPPTGYITAWHGDLSSEDLEIPSPRTAPKALLRRRWAEPTASLLGTVLDKLRNL